MHYYQHNIGDYRKDTSHLTLLEHGIYRQLLDSYYLDEQPLTNDLAKLMRSHSVRSAEEQQSLQNVLTDFFELTENGYVHKRCEVGIAAFHGKSDKARESAKVRWAKRDKASKQKESERNANALQTVSEGNANHKPITNNQEPINKRRATVVACPPDVSNQVWEDWVQLRKSKKASVTQTVIDKAREEAKKAGKTFEEFLKIWCLRGSQGLEASWLEDKNKNKPSAGERNQDVLSGLTRGLLGGGNNVRLLGK